MAAFLCACWRRVPRFGRWTRLAVIPAPALVQTGGSGNLAGLRSHVAPCVCGMARRPTRRACTGKRGNDRQDRSTASPLHLTDPLTHAILNI